MPKHVYEGSWNRNDWYRVSIDGDDFSPRRSQKVRNHSPDGFAWGYGGSGPAQLALAILLEETTQEEAERAHQNFKFQVIARLDKVDDFKLTSADVQAWLERWRAQQTE